LVLSNDRSLIFDGQPLPDLNSSLWPKQDSIAELQVTLAVEETEFLATLLEHELKEKRIEEHRTRVPSYREYVLHDEEQIVGLLKKLGRPPQ
jgi:predicted acetyltransferase